MMTIIMFRLIISQQINLRIFDSNINSLKVEKNWKNIKTRMFNNDLIYYHYFLVGIIPLINIKISFLFHTFGIKSYFPTVFLTMKYVE